MLLIFHNCFGPLSGHQSLVVMIDARHIINFSRIILRENLQFLKRISQSLHNHVTFSFGKNQ